MLAKTRLKVPTHNTAVTGVAYLESVGSLMAVMVAVTVAVEISVNLSVHVEVSITVCFMIVTLTIVSVMAEVRTVIFVSDGVMVPVSAITCEGNCSPHKPDVTLKTCDPG